MADRAKTPVCGDNQSTIEVLSEVLSREFGFVKDLSNAVTLDNGLDFGQEMLGRGF